jgi:serine/threonine protein kinase
LNTPAIKISREQKQKWFGQIEETLKALHSRNIVWGDAKIGNVLIDADTDDAWVIDFGGGATPGWVDQKFYCSKEGDLQALERIKNMLTED